jgi:outer membrane receptor for ferrienterochelin and colicins
MSTLAAMARRLAPLVPLALLALLLAAATEGALAQGVCRDELAQAQVDFQQGKLDAAARRIAACLQARPSREERVIADALQAQIALADDDLATARRAIADLLSTDPGYQPNSVTDLPAFVGLVTAMRAAAESVQVSTVSKTPESLREAPATVVVVTGEEIQRRGYMDLEALLHDLPGFDIARANGLNYSNLYQRGYRTEDTSWGLLLVDGVEENDLWTRIPYLSRQYPLANVDRVEVIYGPASTMYGPHAFSGVINVITKQPEQLLGKGRNFGIRSQVSGGSLHTTLLEAVMAGRTASGGLAWSLTARDYRSHGLDLSRFPDWSYQDHVDAFDYRTVQRIDGMDAAGHFVAQTFLDNGLPAASDLYTVQRNAAGVATAIELTEAGVRRVRELDRAAYRNLDGRAARFSSPQDDWYVLGRLKLSNLVLSAQLWR